jgi:transposase-like protein
VLEMLSLYLSESEGAHFWLAILTDLQNRSVKDILINSVDGLTGIPEAINTIFPETEVHRAQRSKSLHGRFKARV